MNTDIGTAAGANTSSYWNRRKAHVYLYVTREICGRFAGSATSVLDVGSNGTPTLEWHRDHAQRLVSIDIQKPYFGPGIESITGDFFAFPAEDQFDLVTCLQVLEHIPDAPAFAAKLLKLGKVVVISVPYKWPQGKSKEHVHDPVDENKLLRWFERSPDYSYIAREVTTNKERLINVYLTSPTQSSSRTKARRDAGHGYTRLAAIYGAISSFFRRG